MTINYKTTASKTCQDVYSSVDRKYNLFTSNKLSVLSLGKNLALTTKSSVWFLSFPAMVRILATEPLEDLAQVVKRFIQHFLAP